MGGPFALLDNAPDVDILICAHSGLEGVVTLGDLLSGKLVGKTLKIKFWRIKADSIPRDREERINWIFREWGRVDRFIVGD